MSAEGRRRSPAAAAAPWQAQQGARRAAALFENRYGRPPDGVWSAPGRVNLIGEHTDHNGGLCLPIAIGHRTYAAVGARAHGTGVRTVSAQHPAAAPAAETPEAPGWSAYVFGVVRALRAPVPAGRPPAHAGPARIGLTNAGIGNVDIAIDSCVPEGAGLSSSAALECAVALALAELGGADPAAPALRAELVRLTRSAERQAAGVPCGPMDQSASLLAARDHALLIDCGANTTRLVPFDAAALGCALLVIDTRSAHTLADGCYGARRRECAAAERALGVRPLSTAAYGDVAGLTDPVLRARARHVLAENARVRAFVGELESPAPSPRRLGALLDASHASLRDDFAVSTGGLDAAAAAARRAGAYGARMVGAGFGGSVLALVPRGAARNVIRAVHGSCAALALPSPRMFTVGAQDAARRER